MRRSTSTSPSPAPRLKERITIRFPGRSPPPPGTDDTIDLKINGEEDNSIGSTDTGDGLTTGIFASVNDDRDEENTDATGGPLLDNEPHMAPGRKGHRIVSGDDELKYVTLSIGSNQPDRVGQWLLTFPPNIKVWTGGDDDYIELQSGPQAGWVFGGLNKQLIVEGMTASSALDDTPLKATFTPSPGTPVSDTIKMTVAELGIAVDNDRDNTITFGGPDFTTTDKPFLFWLNDNRDLWGGSDYQAAVPDNPLAGPLDSDTAGLLSLLDVTGAVVTPAQAKEVAERDLEDFAQVGLRWSQIAEPQITQIRVHLESSTDPGMKLRLYESARKQGMPGDSFSGTSHVDDQATIDQILSYDFYGDKPGTPMSGLELSPGVAKSWTLNDPTQLGVGAADGPTGERLLQLMFEGVRPGDGTVVIDMMHDDKVLATRSFHLRLRPTDQLFDHYSVAEPSTYVGADHSFIDSMGVLNTRNPVPTVAQLVSPNLERTRIQSQSKDYFMLVHGWRIQEWERVAYAEQSYKRMYWAGYKGQVGLFDWPTLWVADPATDPGNYDRSEFVAWNSAAGLANALGQVRVNNLPKGGKVSVLAHSMGNIVLDEALYQNEGIVDQQGNPVHLVDTAIMSQAAVSSHYLTGRTDLLPSMYVAGSSWPALTAIRHDNPAWSEYYGFNVSGMQDVIGGLTPRFRSIGESAGKILDYYNPDDYALAAWRMDQAHKPTTNHDTSYSISAWANIDFGNVSLAGPVDAVIAWWNKGDGRQIPGFGNTRYEYNSTDGDNRFYRIPVVNGHEGWTDPYSIPLNTGFALYEMFAFCASSIVAPMGQVSNTVAPGVFSCGQDLSKFKLPDGTTEWNTANTGHSAQFAHSFIEVSAYWQKLKGDIQ